MSVWIYWITSLENWQSDWIAVYLLDTVLGCCFFHHDAMMEASNIMKNFIQVIYFNFLSFIFLALINDYFFLSFLRRLNHPRLRRSAVGCGTARRRSKD
jgi:uncharacterized membrane protein